MIRLLALVAVVVPVEADCGIAPPPKPPAKEPTYYWPTKVGTKWVTEHGKLEIRSAVTKVERTVRGLLVTNEFAPATTAASVEQRCLVSGQGIWSFSDPKPDEKTETTYQVLKLPHKPGDKWDYTVRKNNGRFPPFELDYALEAAEAETVTVPAGTYRCIKLRVKFRFNGQPIEPFTSWYSLGVGEVKRENDRGELLRVLKSFTPAKD